MPDKQVSIFRFCYLYLLQRATKDFRGKGTGISEITEYTKQNATENPNVVLETPL